MPSTPNLAWSKQHCFEPEKASLFAPTPDPNVCVCGLVREHPEHLPPKPPPDPAYMLRVRMKEFLDRHGEWRGLARVLQSKRYGTIEYSHALIDALPAEECAQEALDMLWNHADRGQCGTAQRPGCNAEIFWIKNTTGKAVPYDKDMQIHFATCPMRGNFKRKGA